LDCLNKSAADLRRYTRIRTNRTAFWLSAQIRVHPRLDCYHRCPPWRSGFWHGIL